MGVERITENKYQLDQEPVESTEEYEPLSRFLQEPQVSFAKEELQLNPELVQDKEILEYDLSLLKELSEHYLDVQKITGKIREITAAIEVSAIGSVMFLVGGVLAFSTGIVSVPVIFFPITSAVSIATVLATSYLNKIKEEVDTMEDIGNLLKSDRQYMENYMKKGFSIKTEGQEFEEFYCPEKYQREALRNPKYRKYFNNSKESLTRIPDFILKIFR